MIRVLGRVFLTEIELDSPLGVATAVETVATVEDGRVLVSVGVGLSRLVLGRTPMVNVKE